MKTSRNSGPRVVLENTDQAAKASIRYLAKDLEAIDLGLGQPINITATAAKAFTDELLAVDIRRQPMVFGRGTEAEEVRIQSVVDLYLVDQGRALQTISWFCSTGQRPIPPRTVDTSGRRVPAPLSLQDLASALEPLVQRFEADCSIHNETLAQAKANIEAQRAARAQASTRAGNTTMRFATGRRAPAELAEAPVEPAGTP